MLGGRLHEGPLNLQVTWSHGLEPVETRQKQGPMGGLGDGGNMAAAGAGCGLYQRTSLCRSAFLILNLVMPKPLDLPILPYGTHFTVSLSEQPLRKPSVH